MSLGSWLSKHTISHLINELFLCTITLLCGIIEKKTVMAFTHSFKNYKAFILLKFILLTDSAKISLPKLFYLTW